MYDREHEILNRMITSAMQFIQSKFSKWFHDTGIPVTQVPQWPFLTNCRNLFPSSKAGAGTLTAPDSTKN